MLAGEINAISFATAESKHPHTDIEWNTVHEQAGREHYKLLAHLSTRFNGRNIFDIGTHRGTSALALSYNTENKVYSFDIFRKYRLPSIENVTYVIDDLWDENVRSKWQEQLLASAFIFLDIDPHEGTRELEFYTWLKQAGYKGFVVCDDIHYFEAMKEVFWNKVANEDKKDITHLGHWSGTGIIHFGNLNVV